MGKQLGKGDIDALFAAASTNAANSSAEELSEPLLERYDFSRAGQISNDQMRAISSVNDLFARNLMHTMSTWLRTPFKMKLVAGEQLPFSEFLERLSSPSYICSIRLEPLGAVGLLELELALASPIVDVLLGGVGRAWPTRELTEIEEAILTSVVQMAVRELNLAWQSVGLEFVFEKRESEPAVARMLTAGEKTLCVSFEARMPEAQGAMNLCLPAVVLNAILRRLISEGDRPKRRSREAHARIRELMGEAKFGAALQFPVIACEPVSWRRWSQERFCGCRWLSTQSRSYVWVGCNLDGLIRCEWENIAVHSLRAMTTRIGTKLSTIRALAKR